MANKVYRTDIWKRMMSIKSQLVDSCDLCSGTGYVLSSTSETKPCKCMIVFKYLKKLIQAEIPIEYWTLYYKDLKVDKGYIDFLDFYIKRLGVALVKSKGVMFLGANGIGKTAMLCEIGKHYLLSDVTVKYTTADYYLSALRDNNTEFIKDYEEAEVQIFDELGKSYQKKGSDYAMTKIEEYIGRACSNKVLLTASNFGKEDLKEILGESAMSKLLGHLYLWDIEGSDFREKQQKNWAADLDMKFDFYDRNIVKMAYITL